MGGRQGDGLRRKYLSLGTGELTAAAVFGAVAAASVGPRLDGTARAALWSAVVPLLLVLLQGGAYWLLARRWVLGPRTMPVRLAAVYRAFSVANLVVLAAGLAGIGLWWPDTWPAAGTVMVVWVFGLIEYLNYFVVRLSYPLGRWRAGVRRWRTPRLVVDVRAAVHHPGEG